MGSLSFDLCRCIGSTPKGTFEPFAQIARRGRVRSSLGYVPIANEVCFSMRTFLRASTPFSASTKEQATCVCLFNRPDVVSHSTTVIDNQDFHVTPSILETMLKVHSLVLMQAYNETANGSNFWLHSRCVVTILSRWFTNAGIAISSCGNASFATKTLRSADRLASADMNASRRQRG